MKLIGISSSVTETRNVLNSAYVDAFVREGVSPIILPQFSLPSREVISLEIFERAFGAQIAALADMCSGLVLSGGSDINPLVVGSKNYGGSVSTNIMRDYMDLALLKAFVEREKPVLGICRGLQIMGHFFNLPNYCQHIESEIHAASSLEIKERQEPIHRVFTLGNYDEYLASKIPGFKSEMMVNSHHHQGYTWTGTGKYPKLGKNVQFQDWLAASIEEFEEGGVKVIAGTELVVEGFERPESKLVAHQFHPEEFGPTSLAIGYWLDRYVFESWKPQDEEQEVAPVEAERAKVSV